MASNELFTELLQVSIRPIAAVTLLVVGFRVWHFVIRPLLIKKEFPLLSYWIPFIGHGIEFFNNFHGLFRRGSEYVGNASEPFTLYIAGRSMLVVQSPRLIDQIVGDSETFSFDPFIYDWYKGLVNVSDEAQNLLWKSAAQGYQSLKPNPKGKALVHHGLELLHTQLLRNSQMETVFHAAVDEMKRLAQWESFCQTGVLREADGVKVVSLYKWCRDIVIHAQVNAFFGPYINEMEPDLASVWDNWSLNSWILSYGFPSFLTAGATVPREKMIKLVRKWMQVPKNERRGGTAFVKELEAEMEHAGLSQDDSARVLVIILSSINSNLFLNTYWVLAYIFSSQTLTSEIRTEIITELNKSTAANTGNIEDRITRKLVDSCPLLRSTFNETLRVCSTGCTIRKVMKATVLDGKLVPVDTIIFMPQRPLLLSTEAWGSDAHEMNPYRFLQSAKLERSTFYRPFGSGATLCSGRIVGRQEALAFVAILLLRYDVRALKPGEKVLGVVGTPFPRVDETKPSLGVATQMRGDDLVLTVSPRKGI